MTEMQGSAGKRNRDSTVSQMGSHDFVCAVYYNATNFCLPYDIHKVSNAVAETVFLCFAFACLTILSKLTVCGQKTRACICNCSQMVLLLSLQTLHPSCLGLELDCKPPKVTWFFCGLASTEDKAHVSIRALYWARLLPKSTLKSKKDLSSTYVIKQALNYPMIAMSDVVEYYLQSLWVRDLLQYNLPKMASGNLSADIIV